MMESALTKKRDRESNFSREEEKILISLISRYKDILESRKSDSATWREKTDAWTDIALSFCSQSGKLRSIKSLKWKYENIKRKIRNKVIGGEPGLETNTSINWMTLLKETFNNKLDISQESENYYYSEEAISENAEPEMVISEETDPLQLESDKEIDPPDVPYIPMPQPDDSLKTSSILRKKQKMKPLKKSALFIKRKDSLYQSKIEFWQQQKKYAAERNERERIKFILEQKVLNLKIEFLEASLKKVKDI